MSTALRTIIKEKRFEEELASICADIRRADEFIRAAEWALAREPFSGKRIDSVVWAMFFAPQIVENVPVHVAVYYAFNDDNVILLSIRTTAENI